MFAHYFVTKTRASQKLNERETFVSFAEDAPEWLKEAVRKAHQGTFPNDWIFAECRAAVEAFDEGALTDSEDDDDVHAHADGHVEPYTKNLFQWAADLCLTETFSNAEQEANDMGMAAGFRHQLAYIQYAAIRHIADTMKLACIEAAKAADKEPGSVDPQPSAPV